MKKNAMLKIAAILMVAVLLTTCAISSTFAKYSSGNKTAETNTGVVAKWGLAISASNADLFLDGYDNAKAESSGDHFIMAPGTSNSADLGFSIAGSPEVAFKVSVDPTVTLKGFTIGTSEFYCPVKFWVNDTNKTEENAITLATAADVSKIEAAIAKAVLGNDATFTDGAYVKEYEPNATQFNAAKTVTLTWDWAFYVDGATDAKDTALADNGAENSIKIAYTISAEQIATLS